LWLKKARFGEPFSLLNQFDGGRLEPAQDWQSLRSSLKSRWLSFRKVSGPHYWKQELCADADGTTHLLIYQDARRGS